METLFAISVFFVLLAVIFLYSTFRNLRRGRVAKAGGAAAGGVTTASVGGAGMAFVASIYGYAQLTDEAPVASIKFRATGPDSYVARLMIEGEADRTFDLTGDEWQIDARVVTWQPPATILGLEPIYQLDRLSGRYSDIDSERSEQRSVHALAEPGALDVWEMARRFPILLPGVDAYYGTATYVPMADGAQYAVSLSRDALIARPENDAARNALGQWQGPRD